jgi:type III secretion protein J
MSNYVTMRTTRNILQRLLWLLLICATVPMMTSCESRKFIVHDLDERDANEILDFLQGKGIDAMKVQSVAGTGGGGGKGVMWNISVQDKDAISAMSLLTQNGLPRRRSQDLLNIFANQGLVPSEMSEKVRYQAGLAAQIASTIRKMDGVLDAEVISSPPEEDPLHPEANKRKTTAAVYVKHSPLLDDPNANLRSKIRQLVSSSIPGLDYDNVTVILDRARFSDLPQFSSALSEDKSYGSIWSIHVAEESMSRFRIVFFSFMLLLALLSALIIWTLWKVYPVLKQAGGLKKLFAIKPLQIAEKPPADTVTPPADEVKKDQESDDGGVT